MATVKKAAKKAVKKAEPKYKLVVTHGPEVYKAEGSDLVELFFALGMPVPQAKSFVELKAGRRKTEQMVTVPNMRKILVNPTSTLLFVEKLLLPGLK